MSTASVPAPGRRAGAIVDRALEGAALVVVLSMLVTALHDVSQAWDSGYYHLPFAARLVGILPPKAFIFHPANAARFDGFPLLGERLEGLLWRATGRPEGANLLSFGSLLLFALFLRRRFAVAPSLTILALLAVPLVHTHAPSAYVDLPANVALSVTVLLTIQAFASGGRVGAGTLALAGASAAVAANMKALLHPLIALTLVALAGRTLLPLVRVSSAGRRRALFTLGAIVIFLPVVFATPLANLAAHGNPYYPVRMSLLGHALPGTEDAYASSPPWLAGAPRPLRFACSLLEIGIRPLSDEHRWTVDQWMPDESGGNRMGGFFSAYVLLNVALLLWRMRASSGRSHEARVAGIAFAVLTLAVSLMPQSHELRYYLSWMIVLVALNLWLVSGRETRGPSTRAMGIVAAATLAIVIGSTRGAYVLPLGSTFDTLVRAKVDPRALAGVKDGERVCVQREPWNIAFASVFHPPREYVVVEAEERADCGELRLLE